MNSLGRRRGGDGRPAEANLSFVSASPCRSMASMDETLEEGSAHYRGSSQRTFSPSSRKGDARRTLTISFSTSLASCVASLSVPFSQELQADVVRRVSLSQKVAVLEAKDREEQLRQRASAAAAQIPSSSQSAHTEAPAQLAQPINVKVAPKTDSLRIASQRALQLDEERAREEAARRAGSGPESVRNLLGPGEGVDQGEWKPEGWTPVAGKRRGGGGS